MLRVVWWASGALFFGVMACSKDAEPICEDACAYAKKCDLWMPKGDCVDYCIEHFDHSSDECQEKFEKAVNCYGTNANCRYDGFVCSDKYDDADEACGWVNGSR